MGLTYPIFLEGATFVCGRCRAHLASEEDLLSKPKHFQGKHGQAYLFDQVVNVELGSKQDRAMTTGFHRVQDIHCSRCQTTLGWIYLKAFSEGNKYKEGKCVLEKKLLDDV